MIKQPNAKIINATWKFKRSRVWQEEKGTLPCLIVEGDWNYMRTAAAVFPQFFTEGSKQNDIEEI